MLHLLSKEACTLHLRNNSLRIMSVLVIVMSLFSSMNLYAQTSAYTGKVIDQVSQQPISGATVRIKGSELATSTDDAGKFSINAQIGDVLEISYLGFLATELKVGSSKSLQVSLLKDNKNLDEVVVIGYGSIRKGDVTSASSHVKPSEFRQSGARNAMDLLQGKVAGLQISRGSGSNPNSGVSIQIRSSTSIEGSNSPLVVIDGIPGGNLDLLQQEDIESIDVLKDGSAAAIYGTRANGGVVLVTTKKGKSGPTRFDYATYVRKEFISRKLDFMNAEQYAEKVKNGVFTGAKDFGEQVDAFDQLVNKDNVSQYHTLAISGGGENNSFRASAYYRDLQGIAKENGRKEYGVRANFTGTGLQNRLTTSVNLTHNFNDANLLGGGGWEWAYTRNPTQGLKNADGTWYYEPTSTNSVARLAEQTYRRQQQTSSVDGKATLQLIEGLSGSVFGSVQRNSYLDGAYANLASEPSIENPNLKIPGGFANQSTYLAIDYAFEPTLDYKTKINEDHTISAVAGYSYRYSVDQSFAGENSGFLNDLLKENNMGVGTQLIAGKSQLSSSKKDNKLIAFFGRANYAYKGKYMFQGIYRREGSSRFGADNKWGNFGSVSAGWNMAEEDFLKDVPFVNQLKLRAGYGLTGNDGQENYRSLVTLGEGNPYINPDGIWRQTWGPTRNPNPNLKWETKKEFNVGVDFQLFESRLGGSLDYYVRKTSDLLGFYTSQQPSFIRNSIFTNVGQISSRGVELALNYTAIRKPDFSWRIDVTASTNSSKMDSFSDDTYKGNPRDFGDIGGFGALGSAIRTFEGGKLGQFYGKRFAGFTEEGKWLFFNKNNEAVPFNQINDSRTDMNNTDLAVLGNAIPRYYASMTHSFNYKNWDFRIFLRGRFGYDILNTNEMFWGNKVSQPNNLLNSAFTDHAQLKDTYMYSDYYLENGSNVKIDEISVGYNFKVRTSYIRNIKMYATVQNLATITKYKGNDPDYINDIGLAPSIDALNTSNNRSPYPATRSFLVGLNIGF